MGVVGYGDPWADGALAGGTSVDPLPSAASATGSPLTSKPCGSTTTTRESREKAAEMFGRLQLTTQEATPVILDDGEDDTLVIRDWAFVGKVLAPNVLHINAAGLG